MTLFSDTGKQILPCLSGLKVIVWQHNTLACSASAPYLSGLKFEFNNEPLCVKKTKGIKQSTLIKHFMWRRLRVDDIQSLLKELKACTIARISNTSTWLNTHINSGLRSLVFCCVPGRSHRKFHAPLHTENVSFILPTGDKRKEKRNERPNWKRKETHSVLLM